MNKPKLKWCVLNYDWNKKKVVNQNVFYEGTYDELKKARKNKKFSNRQELKEFLRRDFQYHYWSKVECEIMVGDVGIRNIDDLEKIDIYRQLEMNLDQITDYVIKEMNFRFKEDK